MSCSRCQGLMVSETLFNPLEGSIHTWVPLTRCLNCGNVEDSWICRARALPDQLRRSTRPGPQRRGLRREESEGIRARWKASHCAHRAERTRLPARIG